MTHAAHLDRRRFIAALGVLGGSGQRSVAATLPEVPVLIAEQADRRFVDPLLALIAAGGGFRWKIRVEPWPRLMASVTNGKAIAWGMSRNKEREKFLEFSEVVHTRHVWLIVPAGQPQASPGVPGLMGRTFCKRRGFTLDEPLESMRGTYFQVVEADLGYEAVLRMMLAGRCEGVFFTHRSVDPAVIERRLEALAPPADRFVVQRPALNEGTLHFACAKGHPALSAQLRRIDAGLRARAREIKAVVDSEL